MSDPPRPTDARPTLSVVAPLYNEHENVDELYRRTSAALAAIGLDYEILLVDDGSRDATPDLIDDLRRRDPRVVVLRLSRNFGHQAAVSAGLDHARGAAVVVIDGDLQDPPELIAAFVDKWREGYEVVYAVRRGRKEGWVKRLGYHAFYRLLSAISDLDIPLDSGDFCLMDRKVVDVLRHLPERMRFVRGLRSFVGFRQVGLAYDRSAREEGDPKYTMRGLMALAVDGLISFSGYPLRLVTYLGMITISIAIVLLVWVFTDAITNGKAPRGWASMVVTVLFMGSIQLFSLGIIGEYIRLIFLETKGRPSYIVRDYSGPRSERPKDDDEPGAERR
ncbi:MAG: glycosyltransferase family 2 protein [Paludisphaera borealis]|uniref:glycosyltransferase family 2 protein n=1 Tax=Paludisphaera borealis TaxID=1387353 RepID=UPI0028438B1C|nr:glycosyltransferase family 2 protein [Paludisphaera borealis]MDR3621598.1 glycosyltransferase family 2 protein [Paludisphaera borealis]